MARRRRRQRRRRYNPLAYWLGVAGVVAASVMVATIVFLPLLAAGMPGGVAGVLFILLTAVISAFGIRYLRRRYLRS